MAPGASITRTRRRRQTKRREWNVRTIFSHDEGNAPSFLVEGHEKRGRKEDETDVEVGEGPFDEMAYRFCEEERGPGICPLGEDHVGGKTCKGPGKHGKFGGQGELFPCGKRQNDDHENEKRMMKHCHR